MPICQLYSTKCSIRGCISYLLTIQFCAAATVWVWCLFDPLAKSPISTTAGYITTYLCTSKQLEAWKTWTRPSWMASSRTVSVTVWAIVCTGVHVPHIAVTTCTLKCVAITVWGQDLIKQIWYSHSLVTTWAWSEIQHIFIFIVPFLFAEICSLCYIYKFLGFYQKVASLNYLA